MTSGHRLGFAPCPALPLPAVRLRALGVRIGALEPGPENAITDVDGVRVGHVTVWRDEPGPGARRRPDRRDRDRARRRPTGCSASRCPPAPPC